MNKNIPYFILIFFFFFFSRTAILTSRKVLKGWHKEGHHRQMEVSGLCSPVLVGGKGFPQTPCPFGAG